MSALLVQSPGVQTTVQAGPRIGFRHLGVPRCGPADPVAMALANRAVGNTWDAPSLEVTLSGACFLAEGSMTVAVTGAPCAASVDGAPLPFHEPVAVTTGAVIAIGPAKAGCRTYLAVAGGLAADRLFGSASTYLPAGFGGHRGRALREGDRLAAAGLAAGPSGATPDALRQPFGPDWSMRAVPGPEAGLVPDAGRLFGGGWIASRASDRVGVRLDGPSLGAKLPGSLPSVAVLPGTVQLPADGRPIILGVDGGTTGGYARVAQVIRADRHLIGQLRPGAGVRLLRWRADDARDVLAEKTALLNAWIGEGFRL